MQTVAFPPLVMASITFFAGAYHLTLFLKRRRLREHLPFALLCFSVAAYDLFCVRLYNAGSLADGVFWQGLQLQTVNVLAVLAIWFVFVFTGRRLRALVPFACWFGLLLGAGLLLSPEFTLSLARPSIKDIRVLGFLRVTYYEAELGPVYLATVGSALAGFVYLLVLLVRGQAQGRRKGTWLLVAGLLFFFAAVLNDTLVASRLYAFLYLSEYSYLLIVLAMSYALLSELVRLYQAVEDARLNLEARVAARTAEISKLNEELRRQAELDPLTGIYNRRFFAQYLEIELRRSRSRLEYKTAAPAGANDMNFGLAMIDVDHFKRINDLYGHQAGDGILVEIATHIQSCLFTRDVLCRYGGEEFVVLFTRTSAQGILQAVDKIHRGVAAHPFRLPGQPAGIPVTVSIGAVIFEDAPGLSGEQLLRLADQRLLAAKAAGRNLVIAGRPASP